MPEEKNEPRGLVEKDDEAQLLPRLLPESLPSVDRRLPSVRVSR